MTCFVLEPGMPDDPLEVTVPIEENAQANRPMEAVAERPQVPEARSASNSREVDEDRLHEFVLKAVGDLGAAVSVPLVLLGDRLGLFTALAGAGPVASDELAVATGLHERYVREWLLAMAAAGYLEYVGESHFELPPEQAQALTNPDSPAYVAGGFQNMSAALRVLDRLTDAFRTGEGIGWHEHHPDMFLGTERFFRPGYLANLSSQWIPAFDGLQERLQAGASVADVGCGLGASTRILAEAYPASIFVGFDYHPDSVELARSRAKEAGLADRLRFEVSGATELSGSYDLLTYFDCLHDMPDPQGALRAARASIRDDGWVMLVEPMSGDRIEDALNPVGRVFAGASVLICLPCGLSAEPRTGLGNQVGPARTIQMARDAGFSTAREATRTPFNIVYELRP
jgi:2-polyprenyl-3-methyl-5-hydroxy-6-metoxy-1,4-benzoquinol methylase